MDKRRFDDFRDNAKILLVEDAVSVRTQLKALLARERIDEDRILEAPSGNDGLKLFREEDPDVVFLDVMLPDKPGWDVGPEMLELDPEANIVLLTALEPEDPQVRELVASGVVEVLEKPVREEEIRDVLLLLARRTWGEDQDPFSDLARI